MWRAQVTVSTACGVPYTDEDWSVLDEFINQTFECGGAAVSREGFADFIRGEMSCKLANDQPAHAFLDIVQALDVRYPRGARVKATASGRIYVNVIQPVAFDDATRGYLGGMRQFSSYAARDSGPTRSYSWRIAARSSSCCLQNSLT